MSACVPVVPCKLRYRKLRSRIRLSDDPVYRYESSNVFKTVMRDHQPIWRIRSRMSPL